MSTNSLDDFRLPELELKDAIHTLEAPGLPPPTHPAEPDTFARQADVPGHHQDALEHLQVLMVGGGGLGGWTGLALLRTGVQQLTIVEHDRFDRTNATRQLMYTEDLGQLKAFALARNLTAHATARARINAVAMRFEEALDKLTLPADIAVFLVDNNKCRLAGARFARRRRIPAVFAMLSRDAMRLHTFLQGPSEQDGCLHCALPNLDPENAAPCAAGIITSCFVAAAFTTFFVHRAVMGWPEGVTPFNWRESDLLGVAPDRTGTVMKRSGCPTCG